MHRLSFQKHWKYCSFVGLVQKVYLNLEYQILFPTMCFEFELRSVSRAHLKVFFVLLYWFARWVLQYQANFWWVSFFLPSINTPVKGYNFAIQIMNKTHVYCHRIQTSPIVPTCDSQEALINLALITATNKCAEGSTSSTGLDKRKLRTSSSVFKIFDIISCIGINFLRDEIS